MQKYFDLLLELLRPEDDDFIVEEKKKLSATAKKIETRGDKKLRIAHKVGSIFEAYDDLLNENITLDEFLATGDITSKKNISKNSEYSIQAIDSILNGKNNDENSLFILDSISFGILANHDKKIIQDRAIKHNTELVFC